MSVAPAEDDLVERYAAAEARSTGSEEVCREKKGGYRARQEALRELLGLLGARFRAVGRERSELSVKIGVEAAPCGMCGRVVRHFPGVACRSMTDEEDDMRLKACRGAVRQSFKTYAPWEDWQRRRTSASQEALCEKMRR